MRYRITKPKRTATTITEDVWFYQNKASLTFVVWTPKNKDGKRECVTFKMMLSKLPEIDVIN